MLFVPAQSHVVGLEAKHELFQQMLEQINLHHQPEYLPYFESGEIEQVIVHKKSKLWSFQFVFDNVLPFEVFTALMNHMKIKFCKLIYS